MSVLHVGVLTFSVGCPILARLVLQGWVFPLSTYSLPTIHYTLSSPTFPHISTVSPNRLNPANAFVLRICAICIPVRTGTT